MFPKKVSWNAVSLPLTTLVSTTASRCCVRCGADIEDALHCFWTCPANSNILEDSVQNTQYLIDAAVAQSKDAPCLWLRGLLPSSCICIPPEDEPCIHSRISWTNPAVHPQTHAFVSPRQTRLSPCRQTRLSTVPKH